MKKLTLEYIAGFVDGEGCFTILKWGRNSHCPVFCLTNTNLQILEDIQKYLSLKTKISIKNPNNPDWKTCYELHTNNINDCKSIATLLEPYLRLKQKRAQIIMQYPRARHINICGVPQEDISTKAYVKKLYNRIRRLNGRGPTIKEVI